MYIAQDNFTRPYRDLWSRLRVFTLCLLALTALFCGCAEQKSANAPQAAEVAHLQVAPAEGTLEGTATEGAKGLTYGFDGGKLFPHIRMKEGEQMSGHCFVRNTNPHIPVRSVPVTWSVIEGHLRSSRFSIDMTYPSGTQVGDWQICFFMGKGHLRTTTQKITFSAERVLRPISADQEVALPLSVDIARTASRWAVARCEGKSATTGGFSAHPTGEQQRSPASDQGSTYRRCRPLGAGFTLRLGGRVARYG